MARKQPTIHSQRPGPAPALGDELIEQDDRAGADRERPSERPSRESQTRASHAADAENSAERWEERGALDTSLIPARPGMVQLWVRTEIRGVEDHENINKHLNDRWRPRAADTLPKDVFFSTTQWREEGSVIGFRGMVLMERPIGVHRAQAEYYKQAARDQKRSVDDHLMRVHEPGTGMGAPEINRSSRVMVGNGRRPNAPDD